MCIFLDYLIYGKNRLARNGSIDFKAKRNSIWNVLLVSWNVHVNFGKHFYIGTKRILVGMEKIAKFQDFSSNKRS